MTVANSACRLTSTMVPEKKGETEAVGWLVELEKRANGTQLWAKAEWNDLGKTLVSDRRYAYISPTYTGNYEDEHGNKHGTALLGVALTNRPFLTMATVTLSKNSLIATEDSEEENPNHAGYTGYNA
jgi:phage I-like protein